MENPGVAISSVVIVDEKITVHYENGAVEELTCCCETYTKMYETWIKELPPFISDKFKMQMRNITLSAINNNKKCIHDLQYMFAPGKEDEVMKFFTYMRNRHLTLPAKKSIWTVVQ